jgi:hypothetical protein
VGRLLDVRHVAMSWAQRLKRGFNIDKEIICFPILLGLMQMGVYLSYTPILGGSGSEKLEWQGKDYLPEIDGLARSISKPS